MLKATLFAAAFLALACTKNKENKSELTESRSSAEVEGCGTQMTFFRPLYGSIILDPINKLDGFKGTELVFGSLGSGFYRPDKALFIAPAQSSYLDGSAMLVALAKPGVLERPDPSTIATLGPGETEWKMQNKVSRRYHLDFEKYRSFTSGQLVDCYTDRIVTIMNGKNTPLKSIVLHGQSEGSFIIPQVYLSLHKNYPEIAKKVRVVILSGVVMGNTYESFLDQSDDFFAGFKERYRKAIEDGDDVFLLAAGSFSSKYMQDLKSKPSLEDLLTEIDGFPDAPPIHIFHGEDDVRTIVTPVYEYAKSEKFKKTKNIFIHLFDQVGHNVAYEQDTRWALDAAFKPVPDPFITKYKVSHVAAKNYDATDLKEWVESAKVR